MDKSEKDKSRIFLRFLKEQRVRITKSRALILKILLKNPGPWSLQTLFLEINKNGKFYESTVYRVLETFKKIGLVEEFKLPNNKQTQYSLSESLHEKHHHHHIVCVACRKIFHLHLCLPTKMLKQVKEMSNFTITGHQLEFEGYCSECDEGRN